LLDEFGAKLAPHLPRQVTAQDDEQARRFRLLLLGKGAVSARRLERPFAAGMDEKRQSAPTCMWPAGCGAAPLESVAPSVAVQTGLCGAAVLDAPPGVRHQRAGHAHLLFVTDEKVKTHASLIFTKLGVRDCTQVVILAYELGIVEPSARTRS
jgi:hypothetical protein